MHFYTLNIGDFSSQTVGMDNEQVGIFVRLVNRYVSTEKPITEGWLSLAFQKETKEKLLVILDGLFEKTTDGWVYLPAQKWVEEYQNKVESLRANGKKGGRPRKEKPNENQLVSVCFSEESNCEANAALTNNHKPITNNHIKEKNTKKKVAEKPEEVTEQVWNDFCALRKEKKAPLTQTALALITNEAGKAGIGLNEALSISCSRGWQSFKADWLRGSRNGSASFAFDPNTVDYNKGLIDNGDGTYSF